MTRFVGLVSGVAFVAALFAAFVTGPGVTAPGPETAPRSPDPGRHATAGNAVDQI